MGIHGSDTHGSVRASTRGQLTIVHQEAPETVACHTGNRQGQPRPSERPRLDAEFDEGLRIGGVERRYERPKTARF